MNRHLISTMILAVSLVASANQSQAVVLDFNELAQPGTGARIIGVSYVSQGIEISVDDTELTSFSLISWQTGSANWSGDAILGSGSSNAATTIAAESGDRIKMISIDVIDAVASHAVGNATAENQVTFYGFLTEDTYVTQTFTFQTEAFDRETLVFNEAFHDIIKLSWNTAIAGKPVDSAVANRTHHFDNVVVEIIPEPASLALMGLGSLVMLRRRR